MTALLSRLLGRLPVGWMQLMHNRTRLIAAVGGVTFANVLIFMQLGFMNALFETSVLSHRTLDADLVLVSSDFHSLREANPIPRARMFEAMSVGGIANTTPVYLDSILWTDPTNGDTTNFQVIGVNPDQPAFTDPKLQGQILNLREADSALVDSRTREFSPAIETALTSGDRFEIEVGGRKINLVGMYSQGASFDVDGSIIVSDQTFLRMFPRRKAGTPTLVLAHVDAESSQPHRPQRLEHIAAQVTQRFAETDTIALTKTGFVAAEQDYQATQTPIGFVFGFGVAIGLVVGLVIVYQVLSTDVQDHLSEYATFKAIGYAPRFFFGIVFEEAISLAALGFVPGLAISLALYALASSATGLPISMPVSRPVQVFVLTTVMCTVSGAIATRRLNSADPAELF
ncbi:MAG: ABC transporter permease DevC [Planctomycetota bacterium]